MHVLQAQRLLVLLLVPPTPSLTLALLFEKRRLKALRDVFWVPKVVHCAQLVAQIVVLGQYFGVLWTGARVQNFGDGPVQPPGEGVVLGDAGQGSRSKVEKQNLQNSRHLEVLAHLFKVVGLAVARCVHHGLDECCGKGREEGGGAHLVLRVWGGWLVGPHHVVAPGPLLLRDQVKAGAHAALVFGQLVPPVVVLLLLLLGKDDVGGRGGHSPSLSKILKRGPPHPVGLRVGGVGEGIQPKRLDYSVANALLSLEDVVVPLPLGLEDGEFLVCLLINIAHADAARR